MSRTTGLVLAAVAPAGSIRGLGVDVQSPVFDLSVRDLILSSQAYEHTPVLGLGDPEWLALVLSAKESVYKAAATATPALTHLELTDVACRIHPGGSFIVESLPGANAPTVIHAMGRWCAWDGVAMTIARVPA